MGEIGRVEAHMGDASHMRPSRISGPGSPMWPLISPHARARGSNRILKMALKIIRIPNAGRYTSHAFRTLGAWRVDETDSQRSVAADAGGWTSLGFTRYVELGGELPMTSQRSLSAILTFHRVMRPMRIGFGGHVRCMRLPEMGFFRRG